VLSKAGAHYVPRVLIILQFQGYYLQKEKKNLRRKNSSPILNRSKVQPCFAPRTWVLDKMLQAHKPNNQKDGQSAKANSNDYQMKIITRPRIERGKSCFMQRRETSLQVSDAHHVPRVLVSQLWRFNIGRCTPCTFGSPYTSIQGSLVYKKKTESFNPN
jgi:hypothetical protein